MADSLAVHWVGSWVDNSVQMKAGLKAAQTDSVKAAMKVAGWVALTAWQWVVLMAYWWVDLTALCLAEWWAAHLAALLVVPKARPMAVGRADCWVVYSD